MWRCIKMIADKYQWLVEQMGQVTFRHVIEITLLIVELIRLFQ